MRSSAFAAVSAALLLTACGSQNATPAVHADATLAKQMRSAAAKPTDSSLAATPSSAFFLAPGVAPQTVTIVISNPPLTVVSNDPSIATVSFEHGHTVHTGTDGDDRYVTITVTPVSFGYTTITVTDKHSGSIDIPVQVGGGHGME